VDVDACAAFRQAGTAASADIQAFLSWGFSNHCSCLYEVSITLGVHIGAHQIEYLNFMGTDSNTGTAVLAMKLSLGLCGQLQLVCFRFN
jgi:hypothetical protein